MKCKTTKNIRLIIFSLIFLSGLLFTGRIQAKSRSSSTAILPVSARVTSVKALTATLSWIETMAAKYGRNISSRNTLNLTMRLQTYLEDAYISQGKSLQLNPDAIMKFIIKRFIGIPKNKIRKEKSKIKKDLVSAFKAGKFK